MLAALVAAGCAQLPRESLVDKEVPYNFPRHEQLSNGSIYQGGAVIQPLFEDRRPRDLGDTLTIVLDEQVQASKSSASSAGRDSSSSFTPTLVPNKIKKLGELGLDVAGKTDFAGDGASNARNSFTGTITVTVQGVMPNGNLRVRGEKHIGINQGNEYIRFSGTVNPRTISASNSVQSTQVADARIEYVGDGYINEAQTMGWGQRLLMNILPW
ncbi:flagellar basal body L-ring protein FlgH [Pseudomonas putida]|uniref:Flagellar L-ring protein n=2 Tax=Pseudomonas putida TaxID=303 RepID=A0A8I1JJN4_PSEPU|nr:flagellar basal body L-ring protein FlgH [Pseudomonas putida]MBI6882565.1 flagellar basal body L-ring protein FlgH [Pseudomonas putida]